MTGIALDDGSSDLPRKQILNSFRTWDKLHTGLISEDKLRSILLKLALPHAAVNSVCSEDHVRKDGKIDYQALVDWLFQSACPSPCNNPIIKRATTILEAKDTASSILRDPSTAHLPDGSPLMQHFRRIFDTLCGSAGSDGVTSCALERALQAFAQTLPSSVSHRIALIVSEIFHEVDMDKSGVIHWSEFVHWLKKRDVFRAGGNEALAELFELCDANGDGHISPQELMHVTLALSELCGHQDPSLRLSPETVEQIIRDLDSSNSGSGLEVFAFMDVICKFRLKHQGHDIAESEKRDALPHLVLNFDVNNTIIMFDTATGANMDQLLSAVLSNSSWGKIEYNSDGAAVRWVMEEAKVSTISPKQGLFTYTEYAALVHPFRTRIDGSVDARANEYAKDQRRNMIWTFTDTGQPGEPLRFKLLEMRGCMELPESIQGSERAVAAGLTGDTWQLLPSFLHAIHELKKAGRSFTIVFRTFGKDLEHVQKELNVFCEGRHPLFDDVDCVVLDGSDGHADYRMHLEGPSCGTFFRDPERDEIALVVGTTTQTSEQRGLSFYEDLKDVEVLTNAQSVSSHLERCATHCKTYALRDFYPGWAAVGARSIGGKPFMLSDIHNPATHSIFFDDHITPMDPKIVDPININHWPRRYSSSQLFGIHLVQAQPLNSILNRNYFLESIAACEAARAAKLHRWELAQQVLGSLAGVHDVLLSLVHESVSSRNSNIRFLPWAQSNDVKLATTSPTFEEEEEWS